MNSEREDANWDKGTRPGCETGKVGYRSRKAAKAQIRKHADSQRIRPYLCGCGFWHLGHLPPAVVAGLKTVDEVYDR